MKYKILNLDDKPDNNGDYFKDCSVNYNSDELPLTMYFRTESEFRLGTATLSIENGILFAEINFFTTDEAKIEMYKQLAPCIGGLAVERDGKDAEHIKKIEVKSVSLDILNSDPRILSLKGQENVK